MIGFKTFAQKEIERKGRAYDSIVSKSYAPKTVTVAAITNEGTDFYLTVGTGDGTSQRFKLSSEALARKLLRELFERLH